VPSTFEVNVELLNSQQPFMVGSSLDIQCTAQVPFNGVEPKSVMFNWTGPNGISIVNDNRVAIYSKNSSTNIFTSTLHFFYIMEGDEGKYTCKVMILRTAKSSNITIGTLNG